MKKNTDQPANAAELRGRAEERLKGQRTEDGGQRTELETARLVHELQVHQIELEMQNEELQQARAHAEALLAQYNELYDFAPVGYLTLDREGTIRQLNLTGARLLGLDRSRSVNRRFGQFVAEGGRRAFSDFLEKVFASEAKAGCEVTLPQAGHPPRFVQVEGTRSADGQECLAVVQDHTERRQAQEQAQAAQAETLRHLALSDQSRRALLSAAEDERETMAALRESERSLRETQRIARLGSYVLHIPSGSWSSSDVLDRVFGIDEAYDRSVEGWEALVHPDDRTMLGGYLRNEVIAQGGSFDKEYRIVRHDDQAERWVHGFGKLEFDAEGHPLTMHGTIQDVTERRQAEEEIRQLNQTLERRVAERTAQLEAANKELEAFSYSVSHDLRAPLRAIDGFTRILAEEYTTRLDDEGRRLLGVVCGEARRMGQLIDDLLAFSKMSRQQAESAPIDMTALAQAVFAECAAQAPGRQLQFQVQPLPPARGDHVMLRQVMQNLCSNAIKYTRPRAVAQIEIGGRAEGEENLYYVKDNGVGFDMKYADKLFGVFQRLHAADRFEGTGVGLALVQRVIHRHGGRIWAEAKLNEGATFYFTLPMKKDGT
jgi:signal transduction histidine kinase